MHETMTGFLNSLEAAGKSETAIGYHTGLAQYQQWLEGQGIDPLRVTTEQLHLYQVWLAQGYLTANRKRLAKSTQVTRLSAMKSYYGWLYRSGQALSDPSAKIRLPKVRRSKVACDHLSQQETAAILQTQAGRIAKRLEGSQGWAMELRNLALLCVAIATGRRRASLVRLKVADADVTLNELRVTFEKGKPGRVLPCAAWAIQVVKQHVTQARPVLLNGRKDQGFLFPALNGPHITSEYPGRLLKQLQQQAAEEHPDLTELPAKRLTAHSMRVTFATLLFLNGANIRSVNELLLHRSLATTAKYTPIPLEDLRRVCQAAHPRA